MGLFGPIGDIFGTVSGMLRQPGTNFLANTVLSWLQGNQYGSMIPGAPNTSNTMGGAPIAFSPAQNALLQPGQPTSMLGATDPQIRAMQETYLGDAFANAMALQEKNDRMLGVAEGVAADTASMSDRMNEILSNWDNILETGQYQYGQALAGVEAARETVKADAAASFLNTREMVDQFFQESEFLRAEMANLYGDVMAEARNNTATLLKNASEGTYNQWQQAIGEFMGSQIAQGNNVGQSMAIMAQMTASSHKQVGDLLGQIGAQENARLSALDQGMAQMSTSLDIALAQGAAGILGAGLAEIGATTRALMTNEVALTQLETSIRDQSALWSASVNEMKAGTEATFHQLAMSGRSLEAQILDTVIDPVVQLGPMFEGIFNMQTGLEDYNYQLALGQFSLQTSAMGIIYENVRQSLNQMFNYGTAEHFTGIAEQNAQQASVMSLAGDLGGAWIGNGLKLPSFNMPRIGGFTLPMTA